MVDPFFMEENMDKKNLFKELRGYANNTATLTITPSLSNVDLSDKSIEDGAKVAEGTSIFSVFNLAIIDNDKKTAVSANISVKEELKALVEAAKHANFLYNLKKWGCGSVFGLNMNTTNPVETKDEPTTDDVPSAYRTRFSFGTYGEDKKPLKGLSPIDVLLLENVSEENKVNILNNQKKMLEKAISDGKYVDVNSALVKAIEEALELHEAEVIDKKIAESLKPLPLAYTVRFKFGNYGEDKKPLAGLSPAKLSLLEPDTCKDILSAQYKMVQKNLADESKAKFKKYNEELALALRNACELINEGKISRELVEKADASNSSTTNTSTTGEFKLFESGMKIPNANKLDENNHTKEYDITVYCNLTLDYPIKIVIANRKIPVVKTANGGINGKIKDASEEKFGEIRLSMRAFIDRVEKMDQFYNQFCLTNMAKNLRRIEELSKARYEEAVASASAQ